MFNGLRTYLKASFSVQPPGYAEAKHYLQDTQYRDGLYNIESQVLDGTLPSTTPTTRWGVAPENDYRADEHFR
jgi:hypothetical protein